MKSILELLKNPYVGEIWESRDSPVYQIKIRNGVDEDMIYFNRVGSYVRYVERLKEFHSRYKRYVP